MKTRAHGEDELAFAAVVGSFTIRVPPLVRIPRNQRFWIESIGRPKHVGGCSRRGKASGFAALLIQFRGTQGTGEHSTSHGEVMKVTWRLRGPQ